jgi:hypothetical protein
MGIYPLPFLDVMHVSVNHLIEQVNVAKAAGGGVLAVR